MHLCVSKQGVALLQNVFFFYNSRYMPTKAQSLNKRTGC